MATYQELLQQRKALDEQIAVAQKQERQRALANIKAAINLYGFTSQDIFATDKRAGMTVPPKYRNPQTGDTWTGRCKEPVWIRGQDRAKFLIQQG